VLIFGRQKSHVICQLATTVAVLATMSALQIMAEESVAGVTGAYLTSSYTGVQEGAVDAKTDQLSGREQVLQMLGPATNRPFLPCLPWPVYGDIDALSTVGEGWKSHASVLPPMYSLGVPHSKKSCYRLCEAAKAKYCAYQCGGCFSSSGGLAAASDAGFEKCFQYAVAMPGTGNGEKANGRYGLTFFQYAIEPWLGSDTTGAASATTSIDPSKMAAAVAALEGRVGELNRTTDPGTGLLGHMAVAWGAQATHSTPTLIARKQCRLNNFTCDASVTTEGGSGYCRPAFHQIACGEVLGHVSAEDAESCAEETAGIDGRRLASDQWAGQLTEDIVTGFINSAHDDDWYKCDLKDFTCALKVGRTYVNNGGRNEAPCCKKLYHQCTDCSPLDACQCIYGAMEGRPGGCAAVSAYSVTKHTKESTGCRIYSCWASLPETTAPPCAFLSSHKGSSWEMMCMDGTRLHISDF
jgi:hypothetical protein